ncbi:hypothetical protein JKF63_01961 [Porcisia hertigi]|uniref:Uncharacterized protein n=1 Tax=Porcisia hertigi TaxID=2761500 RepID=A0A836IBJ0_9TRYP|nr:hypothetical protein JKF63_01961 [Porcisia hertigi]
MKYSVCGARVTSGSLEEGNAIPPPDLSSPPFFYGFITLIVPLSSMAWLLYTAYTWMEDRSTYFHHASPILSSRWHVVLWMAVSPQLLFLCFYASWMGWELFKHN